MRGATGPRPGFAAVGVIVRVCPDMISSSGSSRSGAAEERPHAGHDNGPPTGRPASHSASVTVLGRPPGLDAMALHTSRIGDTGRRRQAWRSVVRGCGRLTIPRPIELHATARLGV